LPANMGYIMSLISLGVNTNALNNAGQTFLHVLPIVRMGEYSGIFSLLSILKLHDFNFHQQDHLGQSALHLLTRPWIPESTLGQIITTLHSLQIGTSASRDYLGHTVIEQLNYFRAQASNFNHDHELAILGLTCETEGHIIDPTQLQRRRHKTGYPTSPYQYLHNYEKNTSIETIEDLQRYEHHADLLRTISKAGAWPWFEDSNGRNGLHCLAEVSFRLPIPGILSNQAREKHTEADDPRERYLVNLLAVGVDTNSYDKGGNTPLMSFVRHAREDDNDNLTSRILCKLLDAGADVHRRNRQGETALHLAVKLGCRGATKLLLKHGANVHARTVDGMGVIALGYESCRKAKRDQALYAHVMLCMSLAIGASAVSAPTVLQEWASL